MIESSTKLLRPLLYVQGEEIVCSVCSCKREPTDHPSTWYEDFSALIEPRAHYCPEHALLEDLDPEFPGNQTTLYGVPVTRKMPLQVESLHEIFSDLEVHPSLFDADKRGNNKWWVSLPTGRGFCMFQYVNHTAKLLPVFDAMPKGVNGGYYIDIIFRENGTALVSLKYQLILGQRFVCIVPKSAVFDFFKQVD